MHTQRLTNEIAIITGSDSGIGQATAIAFAEEGADVAVTYLHDRDGAEHTRRAVQAARRRAVLVQFDQREPDAVQRLFEQTESELGTPTSLVNDAGIDTGGKPVAEMSLEEWDDAIRTNLYGPFNCCREFIRRGVEDAAAGARQGLVRDGCGARAAADRAERAEHAGQDRAADLGERFLGSRARSYRRCGRAIRRGLLRLAGFTVGAGSAPAWPGCCA